MVCPDIKTGNILHKAVAFIEANVGRVLHGVKRLTILTSWVASVIVDLVVVDEFDDISRISETTW
ncbi:MAG: hypothetical protein FWC73_05160 [Defluviitaleaceae bacterium]|nr:hypothetical protein [Defluviitaleaceae bacterium]